MSVLGQYIKDRISPSHVSARIDNDLPLGLKIGSLVSIEPTPFIFAKRAGLLLDAAPPRQQVAAWGSIDYQGLTTHRFYFEDGVHMLQVLVDGGNVIDGDPFLYKLKAEIRPDDWSLWLANEDLRDRKTGSMNDKRTGVPLDSGFIGFKTFDLYDLSKQPPVILGSYARTWKPTVGEQAIRERMTESLWREPYDGREITVEHECMMYGRKPPNPGAFPAGVEVPDEWLLLTKAVYPNDAVVQAYVGMPIAKETISVVMS